MSRLGPCRPQPRRRRRTGGARGAQVGWCLPHEFGALIADLRANTPGAAGVVFSTHCQNDLGLSTANSLAGAAAGARQVECTINGIGERAGNASLEEVVMAINKRGRGPDHPYPTPAAGLCGRARETRVPARAMLLPNVLPQPCSWPAYMPWGSAGTA